MHIYLTGFRGSGKSTIAHLVGSALSRAVVDLDQELERLAGRSIRELFEQHGESYFRELESEALMKVAGSPTPSVVALGGGAILRPENRRCIAASGLCAWLRVPGDVLCERLASGRSDRDHRPPLTGLSLADEVRVLLAEREPIYMAVADVALDADRPAEEVASALARWVRERERVP